MISYHGRSKSEIIRNHKVCLEKMKVFALTAGITLAQNGEVTTTVAPSANEVSIFQVSWIQPEYGSYYVTHNDESLY